MSKSKYRIFMVNGSNGYANWFPFDYEIVREPNKANVAWWEGGCDVDPKIYGEKPGSHTYFSKEGSKRELDCWNYFKDKPVFKIGTCRGLQNFVCFNGGRLAQHTDHPGFHSVILKDGNELDCISLHHQQGIVDEKITGLKEGKDYELIGWTEKLSPFHLNGDDNDYKFKLDYKEPEILYFPQTGAWCHQSHCEMMPNSSPFVNFCQNSVAEKITNFFK